MFIPSNRAVFSLKIPAVQHDLRVLKFRAEESINQPYSVMLEVVSESADLDLESFLHRSAFLAFDTDGHGIHGKIDQFAQGDSGTRFTHYHLTLVPQLYTLGHRINQRIFQQQTVRQIITTVLEEHGILEDRYQFKLSPTVYEPREYCTQYDESDLHFIQRLCEEEGWHYHFEHSEEDHILVFGDGQTAFKKLEAPTPYKHGAGMVADEPAIHRFQVGVRTTVSRVTRRDYDFKQPHFALEASTLGDDPEAGKKHPHLEDYEYPGSFSDENTGKRRAACALERRQIEGRQARGGSVQPCLHSGHYLELTGHPRHEWNDLWLLTEVVHEGRQPQVLEESLGAEVSPPKDDFTQGYRNTFSATPALVFYRPQIEHARPSLLGSQTARVTGPDGEEIHCDEYGRVKVRFHWDRAQQSDEHSSCWLRVSASWAGPQFGSVVIPRVGMEVVVSFLEGDPDQPLITGCLHHQNHPTPYSLPEHKTRSVFKSRSTPGAGGANELYIEDRKGAEEVYLRAQRDLRTCVLNDSHAEVGNERHETIKGNRYSELHAEEHLTIAGDRRVRLSANDSLSVAGLCQVDVTGAWVVQGGEQIHLRSGGDLILDAGAQLTLKAGGHHLVINGDGIFCSTLPLVGGSASSGQALMSVLPQRPGETVNELTERVLALTPLVPIEPATPPVEKSVCEQCLLKRQKEFTSVLAR